MSVLAADQYAAIINLDLKERSKKLDEALNERNWQKVREFRDWAVNNPYR